MPNRLDHLNPSWQEKSLAYQNDAPIRACYLFRMAEPRHDWYLKEWLRTLHKKQADIVRELDWNKARVSLMMRGEQQYTRDAVNELAAYLNLEPHELLMHPEEAMANRNLRHELVRITNLGSASETTDEIKKVSLG
jgi:plasmid maintenance system antidote protein VapI